MSTEASANPAGLSPPPGVAPGSLKAWILAVRAKTLSAAAVPVLVGSAVAYAGGGFRLGPALAALLGALFIQVGTNFANDVFDTEKGADTADRLGPPRTVQLGLIRPNAMRRAMAVAFGIATLSGVYLTIQAGFVVVIIGLASIAAGIAYTGGPYPLGYHGLGDLFVLIFFGFVAVCGTVWVEAGRLTPLAWWSSLAVGALTTNILVVNNLRDRTTDARTGKRTLAVRLGHRGTQIEYFLMLAIGFVVPLAAALGLVPGYGRSLGPLLALGSLPFAISPSQLVFGAEGRALNPALGATAKLLFVWGLLFSAGLVAGV